MEKSALYSLMEGETVLLELPIANASKGGGGASRLLAVFSGLGSKHLAKKATGESVFVITNKRVIIVKCVSADVCCCGRESREVWTWSRDNFHIVEADYEKAYKKTCCCSLAIFDATISLTTGQTITFSMIDCTDEKALALLGLLGEIAS